MHPENIGAYAGAWYELWLAGTKLDDNDIGGLDDLMPNDELGGD